MHLQKEVTMSDANNCGRSKIMELVFWIPTQSVFLCRRSSAERKYMVKNDLKGLGFPRNLNQLSHCMPLEKHRLCFVNSAPSYKKQEIFLAHFPLVSSTAGRKSQRARGSLNCLCKEPWKYVLPPSFCNVKLVWNNHRCLPDQSSGFIALSNGV